MRPTYGVIGNWCGVEYMECGVMWYVSNVKWGAACEMLVVWCTMWPMWCDLKYGIAKWNSVLRLEVLVWYEMCEVVRNGATWNVVWFGIMPVDSMWNDVKCASGRNEMWWGAKCNGNALYIPHLTDYSSIFHIEPHFRHSTPYHILHHSTYLIPPDHTWRDVDSVVWNLVWSRMFCNARCGMLCLLHPNVAVTWSKVWQM